MHLAGFSMRCSVETVESRIPIRWEANFVSFPKISLCLEYDWWGLVIFAHVCSLTAGNLCIKPGTTNDSSFLFTAIVLWHTNPLSEGVSNYEDQNGGISISPCTCTVIAAHNRSAIRYPLLMRLKSCQTQCCTSRGCTSWTSRWHSAASQNRLNHGWICMHFPPTQSQPLAPNVARGRKGGGGGVFAHVCVLGSWSSW